MWKATCAVVSLYIWNVFPLISLFQTEEEVMKTNIYVVVEPSKAGLFYDEELTVSMSHSSIKCAKKCRSHPECIAVGIYQFSDSSQYNCSLLKPSASQHNFSALELYTKKWKTLIPKPAQRDLDITDLWVLRWNWRVILLSYYMWQSKKGIINFP